MTSINSLSVFKSNLSEVLDVIVGNLTSIEKMGRRHLSPEFDGAFCAVEGKYTAPQLQPLSSTSGDTTSDTDDDDDGDSTRGKPTHSSEEKTGATATRAMGVAAVLYLRSAMDAQEEIATRLAGDPKHSAKVNRVIQACRGQRGTLQQCFDFLSSSSSSSSAALSAPASEQLCNWGKSAATVKRRSTGILSWLKMRGIGDAAVASAAPPATDPSPSPPPPAAEAISTHPRPDLEEDSNVLEFNNLLDATGVLGEFMEPVATVGADMINITASPTSATTVARKPVSAPAATVPESSAVFDLTTVLGRRNMRAKKLTCGILQPVDEEMDAVRLKIISQFPTLRELMSVFGGSNYNIIAYQIRSTSQQIGESGPLLWAASLDTCVSVNYNYNGEVRARWLDDRVNVDVAEPSEREQYRWVELVQSEPSVRGAYAKARIVSMAAKMLFPREFDWYCGLGRDDVCTPDDKSEWESVLNRQVGRDDPFGPSVSFSLNRKSFLAQAFRLMEQRAGVGALKLEIEAECGGFVPCNAEASANAYIVRIRHSNGSALATQSTAELFPARQRQLQLQSSTLAPHVPVVPVVLDAMYKAAEKLNVLADYLRMKQSFDRLLLPVVNEPREYVQNYISLFFGMITVRTGRQQDALEAVDSPVAGRWSTTVRVSYPCEPATDTTEFRQVTLGSYIASTKKVARNEALMLVGKVNFTAEVLRMLKRGTTVQKCHAEALLTANAPAIVGLTDSFRKEEPKLTALIGPYQKPLSTAPGEAVAMQPRVPYSRDFTWCDVLISETIYAELKRVEQDVHVSLSKDFPSFSYQLQWAPEVMDTFLGYLTNGERIFGNYVSYTTGALARLQPKAEEPSDAVPIKGPGPIEALHNSTRLVRERLELFFNSDVPTVAKRAKATETSETYGSADLKKPQVAAKGDQLPVFSTAAHPSLA